MNVILINILFKLVCYTIVGTYIIKYTNTHLIQAELVSAYQLFVPISLPSTINRESSRVSTCIVLFVV